MAGGSKAGLFRVTGIVEEVSNNAISWQTQVGTCFEGDLRAGRYRCCRFVPCELKPFRRLSALLIRLTYFKLKLLFRKELRLMSVDVKKREKNF